MPWVALEPTIPAFERAKTGHALDAWSPWSAVLGIFTRIFSVVLYIRLHRWVFVMWGRLYLFGLFSFFVKEKKYIRQIITLCHMFQRHKLTLNAIASWPTFIKFGRSVDVVFKGQPYLVFLNFLKSVITYWTRVFLSLEQRRWRLV
jgi:hypothetical protein